jgi:hypothetical protein
MSCNCGQKKNGCQLVMGAFANCQPVVGFCLALEGHSFPLIE